MISPIDYEQAQRAQASAEPKGRAA
jgi:hypothetical protein